VEVLTWRRLVTYYVLFFIHPESRRLQLMSQGDKLDFQRRSAAKPERAQGNESR
jgi:hypothetical protein